MTSHQATHPPTWSPPPPPRFLSSFVGRERETAEVAAMLRGGARLISLIGPGGVGKTRLAARVAEIFAAESGDCFPDGVAFVRLDTIRDPALLAEHVAQAFGVRGQPGQPAAEALVDHLRNRTLLLVLDNYEHLLAAATVPGDLLHACPRLAILVTSRERLRITGERLYPVEPLELPDAPADPATTDERYATAVASSEAGRLFLERARAVNPRLTLSPDNAAAVAAVCRRLDGLPLAIELAAGRARAFSPAALAALLEPALPLLATGPRDAEPRHQTLQATIAWSYDRLPPERQATFRRLGVFVGGFDLTAAAAVVALGPASEDQDLDADTLEVAADRSAADPEDLFGHLDALAEQHLLRAEEGPAREPRFGMLETTREFALRQLARAAEEAATRTAHATYFHKLAEEAYLRGLRGPDQEAWLDRLEADHANLRSALRWALDVGDVRIALGLARSLQPFWARRGYLLEARSWLQEALAASSPNAPLAGDDLDALRASALIALGNNAVDLSDFEGARAAYEESLGLWRRLDESGGAASALANLGTIALREGKYQEARARFEAALPLFEHLGNRHDLANLHFALAEVALAENDLERASRNAEEAFALHQQVGNANGVAFCYLLLSRVARGRVNLTDAHQILDHAEALFAKHRNQLGLGRAVAERGHLRLREGNLKEAQLSYQAALRLHRQTGNQLGVVQCVEGLAVLASLAGQREVSCSLLHAMSAARARLRAPRAADELAVVSDTLAVLRQALGEERWATAAAIGRGWSVDEAARAAADLTIEAGIPQRRADVARPSGRYKLTRQQLNVLQLVAEGLTDREIADRLFIARRTVTTHMEHILAALGVDRRAAAVALAIREGLLTPASAADGDAANP